MTTVIDVAPDQIRPSPFNHRRKFNGLDELGASLLEKGVISPLTVRPSIQADPDDEPFELVVGERRWRAATKVGLGTIPVIVRELGDREVIEIQLVENVQREDVHPMEEAEGYSVLIEKHGYDVDQLVTKTGKSRTAIYNRLKLLKLAPRARKAFLDDKFNASIAELISRIPTSQLQDQAVGDITRGRTADPYELDQLGEEDSHTDSAPREGIKPDGDETLPLSFREAQLLLQRRYMLRLELAPFDTTDPKLTSAGACTKCVLRTGNQPDLFGDVSSPDVCTSPPCFDAKKKADWAAKAEGAKTSGRRVLNESECDQIFQGDRLRYGTPFADLGAEADWEFQSDKGGKRKTWAQVIGKDVPAVTLARDEGGAAHELVVKADVIAKLKAAGKLPKQVAASSDSADGERQKAARKQQLAALELRRQTATRAIEELLHEPIIDVDAWKWLAVCVIRQASMEAQDATRKRRGLDIASRSNSLRAPVELALLAQLNDFNVVAEVKGMIVELLAWEGAVMTHATGFGDNLVTAAKTFGIDLKKIQTKVVADSKTKAAKPTAKKPATDDGKRCGILDGKNGKPCIHDQGHDSVHSNGNRTWSDRKPKTKKGSK